MKKALQKLVATAKGTSKGPSVPAEFVVEGNNSFEFQIVKQLFIEHSGSIKRKKRKEKKKGKSSASSAPDLPDEALEHILSFLPAGDLLRVQCINKRCHSFTTGDHLWKAACSRRYACLSKTEAVSWKEFYLIQEMLLFLLRAKDEEEGTHHALCCAAFNHHTKSFRELVKGSNEESLPQGLLMACIAGATEIVEYLIVEMELDVNEEFKIDHSMRYAGPMITTLAGEGHNGHVPAFLCTFTPAEIACILGHTELLDFLLSRNAQLRISGGSTEDEPPPNRYGQKKNLHLFPSVLQGALKNGKPEIIERLLAVHGDRIHLHDEGLKSAAISNERSLRFLLQRDIKFHSAHLSMVLEFNYPDECFSMLWDTLHGNVSQEVIAILFKSAAALHRWKVVQQVATDIEYTPLQPDTHPWREEEEPTMTPSHMIDEGPHIAGASIAKLCEILTGPDADSFGDLRRMLLCLAAEKYSAGLLGTLLGMYYCEELPTGIGGDLELRKERIVELLYEWLNSYPEDFVHPAFQEALAKFFAAAKGTSPRVASLAARWSGIMSGGNENEPEKRDEPEKEKEKDKGQQEGDERRAMERPVMPVHLFSPLFSLMDLSVEELAKQIALLHAKHFGVLQVQQRQLAPKTPWLHAKAVCPSVTRNISLFNGLVHHLTEYILCGDDAGARAKRCDTVMLLGLAMLSHNDFDGLMAVYSSTDSGAIGRLRQTAELLNDSVLRDYKEATKLMSAQGQYITLRRKLDTLQKSSQPQLTFLGMHLRDFALIEDSDHDVDSAGRLNVAKLRHSWLILTRLRNTSHDFPYVPLPCVQEMLDTLVSVLDSDACFNRSLEVEPKQR